MPPTPSPPPPPHLRTPCNPSICSFLMGARSRACTWQPASSCRRPARACRPPSTCCRSRTSTAHGPPRERCAARGGLHVAHGLGAAARGFGLGSTRGRAGGNSDANQGCHCRSSCKRSHARCTTGWGWLLRMLKRPCSRRVAGDGPQTETAPAVAPSALCATRGLNVIPLPVGGQRPSLYSSFLRHSLRLLCRSW